MGGENKKRSQMAVLLTCSVCFLLTLVTCSWLMMKYFQWHQEIADLRSQIELILPKCAAAAATGPAKESNDVIDSSSAQVQNSGSLQQLLFHSSTNHLSHIRRRREVRNENGTKVQNRPNAGNSRAQKKKQDYSLAAIQFQLNETMYSIPPARLDVFKYWIPMDWCKSLPQKYFEYDENRLKIRREGLYYVYAQVTYKNRIAANGFQVKIDAYMPLFTCLQERRFPPENNNVSVADHCYAGAVTYLRKNQDLSIWNKRDGNLYSPMDLSSLTTFWGVMRIGS